MFRNIVCTPTVPEYNEINVQTIVIFRDRVVSLFRPKPFTSRTDDLYDLFSLHDLYLSRQLYLPILYNLAHAAGWGTRIICMITVAHVSRVGPVRYSDPAQLLTTARREQDDVDHDLSDL